MPIFTVPIPPSNNTYPRAHATKTGLPTCAGIYRIVNLGNGHFYIGSTKNISKRWRGHRDKLRLSRHPNRHLQNAWNKYGEPLFEFQVLEIVPADLHALIAAEQRWLDSTDAARCAEGYNMLPIARRTRGIKRSLETRQRISASNLGRIPTSETREKMRQAKLGTKWPDSQRAKVSSTRRGKKIKPMSEERKRFYRRLDDSQHAELLKLRADGWTIYELSARFNVGKSTCWRIVSGESYRGS